MPFLSQVSESCSTLPKTSNNEEFCSEAVFELLTKSARQHDSLKTVNLNFLKIGIWTEGISAEASCKLQQL
jgi:hypothetical protein